MKQHYTRNPTPKDLIYMYERIKSDRLPVVKEESKQKQLELF